MAWGMTQSHHAANWELDAIDTSDEGLVDYSGTLVSDPDFGDFVKVSAVPLR
jgi:hypothetical protein